MGFGLRKGLPTVTGVPSAAVSWLERLALSPRELESVLAVVYDVEPVGTCAAETPPRCSRGAAEMPPRCHRDAVEMQSRCNRDATEVQHTQRGGLSGGPSTACTARTRGDLSLVCVAPGGTETVVAEEMPVTLEEVIDRPSTAAADVGTCARGGSSSTRGAERPRRERCTERRAPRTARGALRVWGSGSRGSSA